MFISLKLKMLFNKISIQGVYMSSRMTLKKREAIR